MPASPTTTPGKGRPVVLIHGVCMSRRFFERNAGPLAERFRVINVDLRGHGESPASEGGHTVAQYAQDVKHLLDTLELEDAVLVGWSMGTFVIWDLVRQFGSGGHRGPRERLAGPDRPRQGRLGARPLLARGAVRARSPPRRTTSAPSWTTSIPAMLMHEPSAGGARGAARARSLRIGANAGTLHPARPVAAGLPRVRHDLRPCRRCSPGAPTRSSWRPATAPGSQAAQADAELVVFEQSGPLPDVGGARALQPGRRRLDRAR